MTQETVMSETGVLDWESGSRRHEIKVAGKQEGEDEGRPAESVSRPIPKLLGEEHFPHPIKAERARWRATGAKPHTILARAHHFQAKGPIPPRGRQKRGSDFSRLHRWGDDPAPCFPGAYANRSEAEELNVFCGMRPDSVFVRAETRTQSATTWRRRRGSRKPTVTIPWKGRGTVTASLRSQAGVKGESSSLAVYKIT